MLASIGSSMTSVVNRLLLAVVKEPFNLGINQTSSALLLEEVNNAIQNRVLYTD